MRREFFFTLDWRVLAQRYAIVTAFRAGWFWLLTGNPGAMLNALLPNPLKVGNYLDWIAVTLRRAGFSAALTTIVDLVFLLLQLGLVLAAVVCALDRFAPNLLDKVPFFARPKEGEAFIDGKRLRRAWWMTPIVLTFSLTVTLYVICGAFYRGSGKSLAWGISMIGPVPAYIGLFLGVLGLLYGWRFNSSAAATVGEEFNVKVLPDAHPLTQRVQALAAKLDLPPPKVAVTDVVNAFAVGSSVKDAMVVMGVPLARHLTHEELDAIIGHELGHIVSGDMRQMQFAEGYQRMLGGVFYGIGQMGGMVGAQMANSRSTAQLSRVAGDATAVIGRTIINLFGEVMVKGLSRSREYYADAIGAAVTTPEAMRSALAKIHQIPHERTPAENEYAYMMFSGNAWRWVFSTHPTLERRMAALDRRTHLRLMPMRKA